MARPKVTVIGSANADMTGFGEVLPLGGETLLGSRFMISPGGKGLNQATAAARAGGDILFISKLGRDIFGDMLLSHLTENGIRTERVFFSDSASSGCALIEIEGGTAQNRILVIPGANMELTPDEVSMAEGEISDSGAVLAQLEVGTDAVMRGAELAVAHGVPFVLNPAPMRELPSEIFPLCDFFTPNESEAEGYTGIAVRDEASADKAAEKLLRLGVKNVVITLGDRGAYFKNAGRSFLVPPIKTAAVDTTGAGDTFSGVLALALAEGADCEAALQLATAAASLSVARAGGASSCPERSEINALDEKEYGTR